MREYKSTKTRAPFFRRRRNSIAVPESLRWSKTQTFLYPPSTSTTSGELGVQSSWEEMTDVVTPNYNVVISRGGRVSNPMTQTKVTQENTLYTVTDYYYSRGDAQLSDYVVETSSACVNCLDAWNIAPTPPQGRFTVPPSIFDAALTAAYANAYSGSASLSVDLAELGQTVDMLHDLGAQAGKLRKIRKLSFRDAQRLLKQGLNPRFVAAGLSSGWLQWNYGFKPLIMSIQDTMKGYRRFSEKSLSRTGRGSRSFSAQWEGSRTTYWNPFGAPDGGARNVYYVTRDLQVDVRAGVVVSLPAPKGLSLELGLGDNRTFELAWELIPYSFVADWFANIGDYILAHTLMSQHPDWRVVDSWLCVTTSDVRYNKLTLESYDTTTGTAPNRRRYQRLGGSCDSRVITYSKSRSTKVDLPSKPVLEENPFGALTHKLSSAALLYQKFGRRK